MPKNRVIGRRSAVGPNTPVAVDPTPGGDNGLLSWLNPDPRPEPADPARIACSLLLDRALGVPAASGIPAGCDGAVTVIVLLPGGHWRTLVLDTWKARVRDGGDYLDESYHNGYGRGTWIVFAPDAKPRGSPDRDLIERYAAALASGRHVLAVADDPTWLPDEIVDGADFRYDLPFLTGGDIAATAALVCGTDAGEVSSTMQDDLAAQVAPRHLRLARRQGQTPDDYVRRLTILVRAREFRAGSNPRAVVSTATPDKRTPRDAPTLDRLHGMREAVEWGWRLRDDLSAFGAGTLAWADVDRGCLLSGPPGCGKTLFARALAATCGVPLFTGSYAQWLGTGGGHQGDLLRNMRRVFKEAKDEAPSILFLDEVDSFANRGTVSHRYVEWEMQVVNALLAEIDGVEGREGVVLVAACNHPERLDPALVRSGRLDRHIRIRPPGRDELVRILREHLAGELADADLSGAALSAVGSSGADCERFVRGARRRAREAKRPVALPDLLDEIGGDVERSPETTWLFAVHEAGHAVASHELMPGVLEAVVLFGNGTIGGLTVGSANVAPLSADDIRRRLVYFFAGRAAEEVVLGFPTTGAGGDSTSDLAQATATALAAATAYGMDEALGPVWFSERQATTGMLQDPDLKRIVRGMLDRAGADAFALLRRRRSDVEALAAELVRARAMDGDAVVGFLDARAVEMRASS